jgi:hypothetical protein
VLTAQDREERNQMLVNILNKPAISYKKDFENIGNIIKSWALQRLIEAKGREQNEMMQNMDKKLQDTFHFLNVLNVTKVNDSMIKGMNELLVVQKHTKDSQLKVLEFIQKKANQELPLGAILNSLDTLLNDKSIDDNLETLKEFLKDEILRSIEIMARLILENKTNETTEESSTYDPNVSSNVSNRIDFVYNVIMQEMRNSLSIQTQIKNNQEKGFTTLTDNITEGNRSITKLFESFYQTIQGDIREHWIPKKKVSITVIMILFHNLIS